MRLHINILDECMTLYGGPEQVHDCHQNVAEVTLLWGSPHWLLHLKSSRWYQLLVIHLTRIEGIHSCLLEAT